MFLALLRGPDLWEGGGVALLRDVTLHAATQPELRSWQPRHKLQKHRRKVHLRLEKHWEMASKGRT